MVKVVDDEQDAANAERHSAAAAPGSAGLKLGIVRLGRAGGKVRHATDNLDFLAPSRRY